MTNSRRLVYILTGMGVVVDIVPAMDDRCRVGEIAGDDALLTTLVVVPLVAGCQRIFRIGGMATVNARITHAGTERHSDHRRKRLVPNGHRETASLVRAGRVRRRPSADLRRKYPIQTGLASRRRISDCKLDVEIYHTYKLKDEKQHKLSIKRTDLVCTRASQALCRRRAERWN